MKWLNIILIVLFLLSAALQYNDPDPYIWIPIYLSGAILCFLALKGRYPRAAYLAALSVYVLYAVVLFIREDGVIDWYNEHSAENLVQSMKASKPWIEMTREFLGLVLLIIALCLNLMWHTKQKRKEKVYSEFLQPNHAR